MSEQKEKINISCPFCNGSLSVSTESAVYRCTHCNNIININQTADTGIKKKSVQIDQKKLVCFKCGKEIFADKGADAVICKYCYFRNDMSDHKVKTMFGTVLQTHGQLYLVKKGIIETSSIHVGSALINGKIIGDIKAFGSVEILKKGEVKGNITCRSFYVRKGGIFQGIIKIINPENSETSNI